MSKKELIDSYIKTLESKLAEFERGSINENDLFDYILEIKGVFIREIPDIDDAIWLRSGTASRDARIVIGLMKLQTADNNDKAISDRTELENAMRELSLEYDGINNTIKDYTNDGNIINYLRKLNDAIITPDLANIKYCINKIDTWYEKNISKIHSNEYVFNASSHDENFEKIRKLKDIFNTIPNINVNMERDSMKKSEPIIF